MKTDKNLVIILNYLLLGVIAIIMFFPIIWIISSSLKTINGISEYPPKLIPAHPQFGNYLNVIKNTNVILYFRNTMILVIGNTVGTLISSSMVAYPLARMNFKGKQVIFGIILATMMVPTTATIIPQFLLFRQFDWLNSFLPLIVPAFFAYPYNVFLFRQFFKTIPKSLDEAAMIDGCNKWQIFTKILVPLSRPTFITIGTLSAVFWWNELFTPLIYIDSEKLKPLTVGILTSFKQNSQYITMWNLEMAGAVIMIVPPILLYLFVQKYLVEGIKTTGMKD